MGRLRERKHDAVLEADQDLVLTGASAARPYGWEALRCGQPWALDAYLRPETLQLLLDELASVEHQADGVPVLLRTVEGVWPFPSHYTRTRRHAVVARRSARARTTAGPLTGKLLQAARGRGPRPVVDGHPRSETQAAAVNIVGVLWATAGQGASIKELCGAIGITRERFEAAYEYLLEHPPLGLQVQRQGDEVDAETSPGRAYYCSSRGSRRVNRSPPASRMPGWHTPPP